MKRLLFFALPLFLPASAVVAQECGTGCQKLLSVEGAVAGAELGSSVAVRGAVAAVGSPGRDAVTIFDWNGTGWEAQEDLDCPGCDGPDDYFGLAIALDESRLAIGAPRAGPGGRVFRYERAAEGSYAPLNPLPGTADEHFGWSVAMAGGLLVVGAPRADGSRGKVYVYDRNGGFLGDLSTGVTESQFGHAVALARGRSELGRLLVVGAPFAEGTGVVYVYALNEGQAPPQQPLAVLRGSDGFAVDAFGFAVAVDGDTILVGSPQHDQGGINSGAVYFFQRNGASWPELVRPTLGTDPREGDQLGIAVALDGRRALVGARRHDGGAQDTGALYFFERSGSSWRRTERWLGEAQRGAELGIAVALDGVSALAGAYLADDPAVDSGAAYALGSQTDLSVSLTRLDEDATALRPGERVIYRIVINNRGPATSGEVRFQPSPVLKDETWKVCPSGSNPCPSAADGQLVDTFEVAANMQVTGRVAATLMDAPGDDTSRVKVGLPAGVFDPNSRDNEDEGRLPVALDVRIVAENDSGVVVPGQELEWVCRVLNRGPRDVPGASVMGSFSTDVPLSAVSVSCEAEGRSACGSPEPSVATVSPYTFNDTADLMKGDEVVYRLRAQVELLAAEGQVTLAASVDPPMDMGFDNTTPAACNTFPSQSPEATCGEETFSLVERQACPFDRDVCDREFEVVAGTMVRHLRPAVAGNDDELVVAWQSSPMGLTSNVLGRRYTPEGRQSLEISAGFNRQPAIDLDEGGHLVAAWERSDPGGPFRMSAWGRRFTDGTPRGGEFPVSESQDRQGQPDVALGPDGSFLVVWTSQRLPGPSDVAGRLFDARGEPRGPEFRVNTYTPGPQNDPALAVDGEGNFVVVWTSGYPAVFDGPGASIRAQRFAPDGTPRGSELGVSSSFDGSQVQPDVDVDVDGDFVVVWTNDRDVEGRRFSSRGRALGDDFQVSRSTDGSRQRPRVALDPDGSFLVVWQDSGRVGQDLLSSILGRFFTSDGRPLTDELRIAASTSATLRDPAVTRAAGSFFTVWSRDATEDGVAMPGSSIRGKRVSTGQDDL